MTILLYCALYAGAGVFIMGCIARIVMYAKAPIHLRWELYPIPHEAPHRAGHGGSRFEESDWWLQPPRSSLMGELKFMVPEILFLKGLWEFNRGLWWRSFPFHFGLYLLAGAVGMAAVEAWLSMIGPVPGSAALRLAIQVLYPSAGAAGVFMALLGAFGLLVRRLTDDSMRSCTTPGDIFNLLFFLITLAVSAVAWLGKPESAPTLPAIVAGVLTLDTTLTIPSLHAAGMLLASLLCAYIPLTHMSHFIGKYFTYHSVRWDDRLASGGGKMAARMAQCLAYRPTWSAAHVGADGKRTWAQVVADKPGQEARK